MKKGRSIYQVRRENLLDVIGRRFAGNKSAAAEALHFTQPTLIYRYLSGKKQIGATLARKMERIAQEPEFWLDEDHRTASAVEMTRAGYQVIRRVPLLTWSRAATWPADAAAFKPSADQEWISTGEPCGEHAYALRVAGDSMTDPRGDNSFPEGTLIVLDPDIRARPGDFVVARAYGGELTFKQLVRDAGRLQLKPLSPQYRMLELGTEADVAGVLVQAIRVYRRPLS